MARKTHRKSLFLGACALTSIMATFTSAPVWAAEDGDEVMNEGDIIVTARRREETAQETPVAMTVLNDALLERYGVKGIATIAQLTPGLLTGETSGSVGGSISLRGVGSGEGQAFIDQAVAINVDGVQISTAQILRAAQMDLKQIEVLRGPQALFFGKNSPGGVISLTTADAGDRLEALVRGGYEFTADEVYVDGTISTPITDTLGVRLAGHYSHQKGYVRLYNPVTVGQTPTNISRFPKQDEVFLRGSVNFTPSDQLSFRVKGTYTNTKMQGGPSFFSDITYCPYGAPQRPGEDAGNCQNDGVVYTSAFSPAFMATSPLLEGTAGSRNNRQILLTGTMEYKLDDTLTFTAVSGYYDVKERLTSNGGYGPVSNNGFGVRYRNRQFSQEVRLASDLGGAFDFLIGGFYEDRNLYTKTYIGNPSTLARFPLEWTRQNQKTTSVFGQFMVRPAERLELTVGGRYTHETKNLLEYNVATFNTVTNAFNAAVDVTKLAAYPGSPTPRLNFDNFSPEATLTFKPSDELMVFASFKTGYKSGGFDGGYTAGGILGNPARDQNFAPEKVTGGELGLKSQLMGRQLTLNLTGYWYDYKDLQVSTFDTIARAYTTQNAARARVRGVELETRFRPDGIPGLNLHTSIAWNDAKFREYLADCYAGQNQAAGCNQIFNTTTGRFTTQNLAGRRLRKAPEWAINAGGYYEFPVGTGLMASVSADMAYSSGYTFGVAYQPWAFQPAFAKIDATMRLFTEDKRWELALIGRNLTNKRNQINGVDRTGTGGGKGTTDPACTAATGQVGCQLLPDLIGTATLPRTVALQLTFKY